MRQLLATALVLAAAAGSAFAAAPSKPSPIVCGSPKFTAYVLTRLGHGKSQATGRPMSNALQYGPITSSTEVSSSGDHTSCEITIQVSGPARNQTIRGVFTLALLPNGRVGSWKWLPGYWSAPDICAGELRVPAHRHGVKNPDLVRGRG
jgi:hypothetical protein